MASTVSTPTGKSVRSTALDASTMCEAFQLTSAARADQVALRTIGDGVNVTFAQYAERVRRLAAGLHALGVRRGDPVAFMLTNRPEFHLIDTAAIHLGAVPFSVYNTSSAEQVAYLLGDAGAGVMVVEAAFLDRATTAIQASGTVEHLVVVDGAAPEGALTLSELEANEPPSGFDFEATWRAVAPDDLMTLIYTSGTTGAPKGVQLTHANELAQWRGGGAVAPPRRGGAVIPFPPHADLADR